MHIITLPHGYSKLTEQTRSTLVIKVQSQTKYLDILYKAWDGPLTNKLSRVGDQFTSQYTDLKSQD